MIDVWEEYEAQQTEEAKFVKQIDRLEFAMQASVYEHQGKIDGDEFYEKVAEQMTSPDLINEMAVLRTLVGKNADNQPDKLKDELKDKQGNNKQ